MDMWFRRDIHHALNAATEAGWQMAQIGASSDYQNGYIGAIRQMALTFGISPEEVVRPAMRSPQLRSGD